MSLTPLQTSHSLSVTTIEEDHTPLLEVSPEIQGLLSLTLSHPSLIPSLQRLIKAEWLHPVAGGELLSRLMQTHSDEIWHEPAEFLPQCNEAEKNLLAGFILNPVPVPESTTLETMAASMVQNLWKKCKNSRIQVLQQTIKSGLITDQELVEKSKELHELMRSSFPLSI